MTQDLTIEQLNWIGSNIHIFVSSHSATQEQRDIVYEYYNHMMNTQKKPNGCGRCWRSTKEVVYRQYVKQTKVF